MEVFGSMKTGLYLPTSDIDLVVFHNWERTPFYAIRDELIARGICTERSIKVLDNASVSVTYFGLKIINYLMKPSKQLNRNKYKISFWFRPVVRKLVLLTTFSNF